MNAETYLDFFSTITQRICYISSVFPSIYRYICKLIKIIFSESWSGNDISI